MKDESRNVMHYILRDQNSTPIRNHPYLKEKYGNQNNSILYIIQSDTSIEDYFGYEFQVKNSKIINTYLHKP